MKAFQRFITYLTPVALVAGAVLVITLPARAQQATDATIETQNTTTTTPPTSSMADNVCKGVLSAQTGTFDPNTTIADCQETGDNSFGFLVKKIINIFSIVVGAVSVIMIIIGGFRYIISGGDSGGVSGAKNTILYAIVGLLIVLFAQVIIRFILTNAAPLAG